MPRFFHPNVLQSGISILQTPECLQVCQLPGSGPAPIPDSFLPPGPAPPAPRSHSITTQSYSPFRGLGLCLVHQSQRAGAQEAFVGLMKE